MKKDDSKQSNIQLPSQSFHNELNHRRRKKKTRKNKEKNSINFAFISSREVVWRMTDLRINLVISFCGNYQFTTDVNVMLFVLFFCLRDHRLRSILRSVNRFIDGGSGCCWCERAKLSVTLIICSAFWHFTRSRVSFRLVISDVSVFDEVCVYWIARAALYYNFWYK